MSKVSSGSLAKLKTNSNKEQTSDYKTKNVDLNNSSSRKGLYEKSSNDFSKKRSNEKEKFPPNRV